MFTLIFMSEDMIRKDFDNKLAIFNKSERGVIDYSLRNVLTAAVDLTEQEDPDLDPNVVAADSHIHQVEARSKILRFLLEHGPLRLSLAEAEQIWECLAKNAIYAIDREICFNWFGKLAKNGQDFDPDSTKAFFENDVLQLDPSLLTKNGLKCFECFFKTVNVKENKLLQIGLMYQMNDLKLIGLDYLWNIILFSDEDVSSSAATLLIETYTNLGPRFQTNRAVVHEEFMNLCKERMKVVNDAIFTSERNRKNFNKLYQESTKMMRILKAYREYAKQYGDDYEECPTLSMTRVSHFELDAKKLSTNPQRNFPISDNLLSPSTLKQHEPIAKEENRDHLDGNFDQCEKLIMKPGSSSALQEFVTSTKSTNKQYVKSANISNGKQITYQNTFVDADITKIKEATSDIKTFVSEESHASKDEESSSYDEYDCEKQRISNLNNRDYSANIVVPKECPIPEHVTENLSQSYLIATAYMNTNILEKHEQSDLKYLMEMAEKHEMLPAEVVVEVSKRIDVLINNAKERNIKKRLSK